MLTVLRVSNFAIIEKLEVELGGGLNVVTGETGAGKSILVDALSLVLGGRGRPEVVRTGHDRAEVEGLFDVGDDTQLRARLEAAGFEPEDEVVIRREIQSTGRTRAYVNGRLAAAGQLADLATGLVDISSQHEHHTLVDPSTHLEYLDAFAGLAPLRDEVARAHEQLGAAKTAVAELEGKERGRAEREDLLRFQIREIDEFAPVAGEDATLVEERERLRHAESLAKAASGAEDVLYAQDSAVCETLSQVTASLSSAAAIDSRLTEAVSQLDKARVEIEEAARTLGGYARNVTVDPERLTAVEERLDTMGRLKRKVGGSIDAIVAHRASAAEELEQIGRYEDALLEKQKAYDATLAVARKNAQTLSKKRHEAAGKLGVAITKELTSVGMGDAQVLVDVEPIAGNEGEISIDGARLTATGIDRAEFLIAPNRGETARPLRKIASGGELSRAMLAIKRVLAGLGPAGTYVFDEVDAGVGGAVAEVIGRKLREVSRHHQVLCITHLPQIAVFADAHFRVQKSVAGDRTVSTIERLNETERLEEIARMLGGVKITPKTKAAAAEMLKEARQ